MTDKQMKMRQALIALYLEVPPAIAAEVTKVVMDAIEELELEVKRYKQLSGCDDK